MLRRSFWILELEFLRIPGTKVEHHCVGVWQYFQSSTESFYLYVVNVLDRRGRDLEVVVVRRIINLGTGNLEWGGNGKGLKMGRSVYE